jgi:hypothetical protein
VSLAYHYVDVACCGWKLETSWQHHTLLSVFACIVACIVGVCLALPVPSLHHRSYLQVKHSEEDLLQARRNNTSLRADKSKMDEVRGEGAGLGWAGLLMLSCLHIIMSPRAITHASYQPMALHHQASRHISWGSRDAQYRMVHSANVA